MGMRISYNGRTGFGHRQPESTKLQALMHERSNLSIEFLLLCDRLGVPRSMFEGWGDDELRGLTLELVQALGIPTEKAVRLVAKVQGASRQGGVADPALDNEDSAS
jgi:hypothetical protein